MSSLRWKLYRRLEALEKGRYTSVPLTLHEEELYVTAKAESYKMNPALVEDAELYPREEKGRGAAVLPFPQRLLMTEVGPTRRSRADTPRRVPTRLQQVREEEITWHRPPPAEMVHPPVVQSRERRCLDGALENPSVSDRYLNMLICYGFTEYINMVGYRTLLPTALSAVKQSGGDIVVSQNGSPILLLRPKLKRSCAERMPSGIQPLLENAPPLKKKKVLVDLTTEERDEEMFGPQSPRPTRLRMTTGSFFLVSSSL